MNKKTEELFHKLALSIIIISAICMTFIIVLCLILSELRLNWSLICVPLGVLIIMLACLVFRDLSYHVKLNKAIEAGEPTVEECEAAIRHLVDKLDVLDAAISNGIYVSSRMQMDSQMADIMMEALEESPLDNDEQAYERAERLNRSLSFHFDSCSSNVAPLVKHYEYNLSRLRKYAQREYLPDELLQRIDQLIDRYESKHYQQQMDSLLASTPTTTNVEVEINPS